MNITIINDCKDENAKGRQSARISSLLKHPANFIGVSNELEASGNIIDVLDASGESAGIILVNVAPRNGKAKRYPNGTPFGYFWYKKTLVVCSIDGYTLSLVKKLKLTKFINVLDIPETLEILIKKGNLSKHLKSHIINSQFRSYEYLPGVAAFIFKHKEIRSQKIAISTISDAPNAVWWVDNFGNCKTTVLLEEIGSVSVISRSRILRHGLEVKNLKYFSRLKDVPNVKSALITGSSGLEDERFLEIVVQGGSASKHFNLYSGSLLGD